jgi:hypothetical protein
MDWEDGRKVLQGQLRELLHTADACLTECDQAEDVPQAALTMAKALEYAARKASVLADAHVSTFKERQENALKGLSKP